MLEVVDVPGAVRRAAEEARDALLVHLAARRQQRVAGRDPLGQRNEIVLVAARAVQQQERRRPGILPGDEAVDETQFGLFRRVHDRRQVFRCVAFQ